MSIPKGQKFEHVELSVQSLAESVEFYRDVVGMAEIAREDGVVYLGFGLDENYDVAVRAGETTMVHFALRAEDADEVARYEARLREAGVETERRDGVEPNQDAAVRFRLPTGQLMEFVSVTDRRYVNPAQPALLRPGAILPLDTCHINLMAIDVKAGAEFLVDTLGFRLSEYAEPEPGSGDWITAWTRKGVWHHDVAFGKGEGSLHHLAVAMSGFDQIKTACDVLAAHGIRIELGPSRHPTGSNLYIYVKLPGGHRWEFSAEMALLEDETPTLGWSGFHNTLDVWGTLHERMPEGFLVGT